MSCFRGVPDSHWYQKHQLQIGDGQYRGPLVRSSMQVLLVLAARTPLPAISTFSLGVVESVYNTTPPKLHLQATLHKSSLYVSAVPVERERFSPGC